MNAGDHSLKNQLIEQDNNDTNPVQLSIPANSRNSILSLSAFEKEAVDSFSYSDSHELSISDSQLIHFMRKEGILCLPMFDGNGLIGVITLGINGNDLPFLLENIKVLEIFANRAASAIRADQVKWKFLDKAQQAKNETIVLRTKKNYS